MNDRWYLIAVIVVSLALVAVLAWIAGRWFAKRQRTRDRIKRSEMEDALMKVDLDSLTAEGYAAMKKTADRYGLSLTYIQKRQRTEADREAERKAMSQRQQEKLLEKVREDRIRQETMERDAIRSILEEVPEPRHDT